MGGLGRPRDPKKKVSYREAFRHLPRALDLVWSTCRGLTLWFLVLSMTAGALPAGIAWIGKRIVDGVVAAMGSDDPALREAVFAWVGLELVLVVLLAAAQRGLQVAGWLLQAQLGHKVNTLILEKAATFRLENFEDSETYDKLSRSRREASFRPVALVQRTFQILQSTITLLGFAGLLLEFSWVAVVVLVLTAVPVFLGETRFSGEAFRLFNWQTPEKRRQNYLEIVLSRLEYAKEVAIYGLGPLLLGRYRAIFDDLYVEDRDLTLRRSFWVFLLGLVSTLGFYGVYAWVAWTAMVGGITLGSMTMYLAVFKQGQGTFSAMLRNIGSMYEDALYLSTLYDVLELPVEPWEGTATEGADPGDGVRFEGVHFRYPGAEEDAIHGVSLHVPAGEKLALVGHNGSGKTTLIKLLARLYEPSEGRVLLDGTDLREWDVVTLRRRIAVIFQDFAQYQFLAGENVGAGDVERFEDEEAWRRAAAQGMAGPVLEELPKGYSTQLGRWFKDGRELSTGQWQKVALSRAFMREDADLYILDEPTAAMDAEAELEIFDHVREVSGGKMAILISHRFSTVRMADHIVVLDAGRVIEEGTHEELMARGGRYARLFTLQAQAFLDTPVEVVAGEG